MKKDRRCASARRSNTRAWLAERDVKKQFSDMYSDDVQLPGFAAMAQRSGQPRDLVVRWAQANGSSLRRAIRLATQAGTARTSVELAGGITFDDLPRARDK